MTERNNENAQRARCPVCADGLTHTASECPDDRPPWVIAAEVEDSVIGFIGENGIAYAADDEPNPETIAGAFHMWYERLAPNYGYETRRESSVPWQHVPEENRKLMIAVVKHLIAAAIIR